MVNSSLELAMPNFKSYFIVNYTLVKSLLQNIQINKIILEFDPSDINLLNLAKTVVETLYFKSQGKDPVLSFLRKKTPTFLGRR